MTKKLSRIFGIIGGVVSTLLGLVLVSQSLWTLLQPDGTVHFETKGFASFFMVVGAIICLIAALGLVGSFFVPKRPTLAGVLMLISGVIGIFLCLHLWYLLLAPLLLIIAGLLALLNEKPKPPQP